MNNVLCKLNTLLLVLILAGIGSSFYFLNHQSNKLLTELSIDIVNTDHRNRIMLSQVAKFLDHKLAHMPGGKLADYIESRSLENYPVTEFHATPNDFLHQTRCEHCRKTTDNN